MEIVQEIKSKIDIVDFISSYLSLKQAGSGSFKACCPFHKEKTPSFFVNRSRQTWHCFGCDDGGDVISFVQRMEGMEFREALEFLAQKTGVILPKMNIKDVTRKKKLEELNELLSKLMRHILLNEPEAEHAREYIKKRGIDDLTGDVWRIGYAPQNWQKYQAKILEKGFTVQELIDVGFAKINERGGQGIYYRFHDRLMFSIFDVLGHVVGYTGRVLNTDLKTAKYINTPETFLYKKSHVLYGLDKAKGYIKKENLAIITEGNMDALTSHQFNVQNVVASSGTALTQEQLNLIKRFTNNIAIAFDSDGAGLAATLRGLELARQLDFNIKIIRYDNKIAKDPDELIRQSVDLWKQSIQKAKSIMDWIYAEGFKRFSDNTPEGKKNIANFILNECLYIPDSVERDAWIERLSKDLAVSPDALRKSLIDKQKNKNQQFYSSDFEKQNVPELNATKKEVIKELEEAWLSIILSNLSFWHELPIKWKYPLHDQLYSYLQMYYNSHIENIKESSNLLAKDSDFSTKLPDNLKERVNLLAILIDKEFPNKTEKELHKIQEGIEQRLIKLYKEQKRQELEVLMREAEKRQDDQQIQELLQQFNLLNNL